MADEPVAKLSRGDIGALYWVIKGSNNPLSQVSQAKLMDVLYLINTGEKPPSTLTDFLCDVVTVRENYVQTQELGLEFRKDLKWIKAD